MDSFYVCMLSIVFFFFLEFIYVWRFFLNFFNCINEILLDCFVDFFVLNKNIFIGFCKFLDKVVCYKCFIFCDIYCVEFI